MKTVYSESPSWHSMQANKLTFVTGSEKRDLNSLFEMRVLQRSVI